MAVLLNDLFFPKTDPHTAGLLTAFTFCSTYLLRPIGALIFGYIGDNIGRKATVVITTSMMAFSSIIIASLPTYEQIGIAAAWIMRACRISQGLSSMGEIIGAEIYTMEITKPPLRYPCTAFIFCSSRFGSMAALGIATLVTSHGFNWRVAFWIGATIAVVGSLARTRLRETPEFADLKLRMKKAIEKSHKGGLETAADILEKTNKAWKEEVNPKISIGFFMIQSACAIGFYFTYIHGASILKNTFNYSSEDIIYRNFILSIFTLAGAIFSTLLAVKIDALKIVKVRTGIFLLLATIFPIVVETQKSETTFFILQSFFALLLLASHPATANIYEHFPVLEDLHILLLYMPFPVLLFILLPLSDWYI